MFRPFYYEYIPITIPCQAFKEKTALEAISSPIQHKPQYSKRVIIFLQNN